MSANDFLHVLDRDGRGDSAIFAEAHGKTSVRLDAISSQLEDIHQELKDCKAAGPAIGSRYAALEAERFALRQALDKRRFRDDKPPVGRTLKDILDDDFDLQKEEQRIARRQKMLERTQTALERERKVLEDGLPMEESYQRAPVRRVPWEILGQIFPLVVYPSVYMVGDGMGPILARKSAGAGALFELLGKDSQRRLLEVYLARSKSAPLTVHVDVVTGGRQNRAERNFKMTMTLLWRHAHRLRTLRFTGSPERNLDFLRGELGRLEVLELGGTWTHGFDGFMEAPRLHTVTFLNTSNVQVPGQNIHSMHIGNGVTPDDMGEHYPNLTSLLLAPQSGPSGILVALQPVTFLRLQRLKLASLHRDPNLPMDFLDLYTTPELQHLELSLFQHGFDAPRLCSFLRRSRCDLTHLVIKECFLRPREMLEVIVLLPVLEALSIQHASPNTLTNIVVDALAQSTYLPALTTLHIDGSYLFRTEAFLTMLESRTASLQRLEIILRDRALPEPALARFRDLQVDLCLFCFDEEKNMCRVSGDLTLPAIPSEDNDPSSAGFLT
ncbi:hypothetical protein C8R43DRAFT_957068 [Mycena crocata]|nr:hypothetical protein C8R43DRAFT_957068 [Mycena crocata]